MDNSDSQIAFPKQPPTLDLGGFSAKLLRDYDRYSNGSMLLKISDCEGRIMSGDEQIGAIGFSGVLYIESGSRLWKIDSLELFKIVQKAEQEQYLGTEEGEGE